MRCWIGAMVLLSGCLGGGGLCKKQARDLEKECGFETSDAEIEACEASLENCTAKDERQMRKYYDCITKDGFDLFCPAEPTSGAPFTTGSTTGGSTFDDDFDDLAALLACVAEIDDVSQECLEGSFSTSSSYTYGTYSTVY